MMICGGAAAQTQAHIALAFCFFFPAPLPPGVLVAGISNETCVINPCNGVHEFTAEQRLVQPPWPINLECVPFMCSVDDLL